MEAEKNLYLLEPINQGCNTQLFMTHQALLRLKELRKEEEQSLKPAPRFRIRIDSGGCAGFQYFFNFDAVKGDEDIVFVTHSIEVVIDEMSLPFLNGVILDYVEDMMNASFQLKNPNASSSCGCGSSFSL